MLSKDTVKGGEEYCSSGWIALSSGSRPGPGGMLTGSGGVQGEEGIYDT